MTDAPQLRYETNGPEHDFPPFEAAPPPVRYIIASTPRCGSNFLQRALWRTGSAGAPEEYLTQAYMVDFNSRLGTSAAIASDPEQRATFIEALWRYRTSPNGVFGLKLHGSHLSAALNEAGQLIRPLGGSRWIWLRRRNRIAQAISYLMADQTGVWIIDGEWLPRSSPNQDAAYDRTAIQVRLDQIDQEERMWDSFFGEVPKRHPHVIWYEDLVDDYHGELAKVFHFLGATPPTSFPSAGIKRQASDINRQWEERFSSGR